MKQEKRSFLILINAGMELTWMFAWANYATLAFFGHPFPFLDALGIFGLAAVVTLFSGRSRWRVIQNLGLQIFGFAAAFLRIVYLFEYPSHSFFSRVWVGQFFSIPRNVFQWMALFFLFFWVFFFWLRGISLARRPMVYLRIASCFDLGLGAFFLLFLTRLLLFVKGGLRVGDSVSESMVFSFLLFSLLALGLARSESDEKRDFIPGFQAIGMMLSFTLLVILLGSTLVIFFWPLLRIAAEAGHSAMMTIAAPFGSILVAVLRFAYLRNVNRPDEATRSMHGDPDSLSVSPHEDGWWGVLEKILSWGLLGVLGLLSLVALAVGLSYLVRWLFSRSSLEPKRGKGWSLRRWFTKVQSFLLIFAREILRILLPAGAYRSAIQIFTALLDWGRRSGMRRSESETPLEYGARLTGRFPDLKGEIEQILEVFNREVYGQIASRSEDIARGQFSLRKLRSVRYWPSRMRNLILGSGERLKQLS